MLQTKKTGYKKIDDRKLFDEGDGRGKLLKTKERN